jgi:hypothetical protein
MILLFARGSRILKTPIDMLITVHSKETLEILLRKRDILWCGDLDEATGSFSARIVTGGTVAS